MGIETFFIFPDAARHRRWLQLFDKKGFEYGFVSRKRNVISEIRSRLQGYNPLIFHTHFSIYDLSPIFLKLIFYRDARTVWHYHNPAESTLTQRVKDVVKLRLIGRCFADRCIAVGDGVYDSLLEAGFPRSKLLLIHNGVNTERFISNARVRKQVRHSFGIADEQPTFLLLGWDPVRKGVDIFAKAVLESLRNGDHPNARFIVVGREETRSVLLNLQLGSSIEVIDPWEDFSSLINGVDVLVSCSRSEPFSYAIAEAMAAEKLILCSDVPGMREIYGSADGVWLFPSEDSKQLAELIRTIQNLPLEQRQHLGKKNREYVQAHYSLQLWCDKIGDVYASISHST